MAARLEETLNQEEVAEGLVDATQIVGNWHSDTLAENAEQFQESKGPSENEQRLAELQTDREDTAQLAEQVAKPGERFLTAEQAAELREQAQQQPEQQQAQQVEATPEQTREIVQNLDSFNEQYQMGDGTRTKEFALELSVMGHPFENMDLAKLGTGLDRVLLSALHSAETGMAGEVIYVGAAPAREVVYSLLPAIGINPRDPDLNLNERHFATTLQTSIANLYGTIGKNPNETDVRRINDRAQSDVVFWNLSKSFGRELPWPLSKQDSAMGMQLADATARLAMSYRARLAQNYQPQAPQRAGRRAGSAQRQTSGRRWRSNNDIFEGAEEMLANEQTGKRNGQEFAAKPRAQRSRFSTNQDIFSEDVMRDSDLRRL